MWEYITSFFSRGNDNDYDLSLENACKVLEDSIKTTKLSDNGNCVESDSKFSADNMYSTKIGTITHETSNRYIIDDEFTFDKNERVFSIGSLVNYDYFICDGKGSILNVSPVDQEWDTQKTEDLLWNNRILICRLEKRDNRYLTLTPGEIIVDLDNVSMEFLPVVGDWLELDVKCTINENAIDLSGKIIEINKILPLRAHIETGKITHWNNSDGVGTINRTIFFNRQSLSAGYIPVNGDKVVLQVIESDQNRCSWRAVKVIPEYIMINNSNLSSNKLQIPDYELEHLGLKIPDINLYFEKLNDTQTFVIAISVNSDCNEIFQLFKADFLDSNSQCKISDAINENISISRDNPLQITCSCVARNMGDSKEFLLLTFEGFNIGKWVSVNVTPIFNKSSNFSGRKQYKIQESSNNTVIRGQKPGARIRFQAAQLPGYLVPQKLIHIISEYDPDVNILLEKLKIIKPVLFSNLSYVNYEDRFHTLLHLDEIAGMLAIRTYDQERACFIRNGEYLMLEIDNLSERRPSIILGDRVIAKDPLNQNNLDYEGYVHKVGARHIYIKFSPLFHDKYKGEDYTIKLIAGRVAYKRLHHAVYLAVRHLGQDLLFPTRLFEKKPQLSFNYSVEELPMGKRRSVLKKMQEYQDKKNDDSSSDHSSLYDEPNNEINLEWYNKTLNKTQKNAVLNILWGKARPLPYIIFGPPGTGKTVTIIETILQIARLVPQSRLLIAAPSNSAADLIALRLIDSGVLKPGDLIRLVSHNYALSDSIPVRLVPYCATGSNAKENTAFQDFTRDGIQMECSQTVLGRHRITVSTCSAAGVLFTMGFPKGHFSHIIVDEAAQAGEPDVLIPLSFMDKTSGQAVLAGDPMQLGPVVLSRIATECGLGESYLERLINRFPYVRDNERFPDSCGYDPRLVTKLLYNYRSLPAILNLYNPLFYDGELIATIDDEVSNEATLRNNLQEILPKLQSGKLPSVVFHGVKGENYQTSDSPSWYNPHEAAQVFYYVNEFYRLGLKASSLGIISPYIKQVQEIRSLLVEAEFEVPKIGSIEEFQGQEFDVILLSTVRSKEEYISHDVIHCLGFVSSPKRLNVAISRAKSLLVIVGNPNLLSLDTYWRSVLKYCLENGSYVGCDVVV